jgi:hypothetical protein
MLRKATRLPPSNRLCECSKTLWNYFCVFDEYIQTPVAVPIGFAFNPDRSKSIDEKAGTYRFNDNNRMSNHNMKGIPLMKNVALLVLLTVGLMLCSQPVFATDQRAEEILKEARAAVGGDEALQQIQSLAMKGQYRRVLGERELSGEREVSIMLPDKYLVEDSMSMGGMSTAVTNTKGLNGERAWMGTSGGMGGGGIFFKMAGPGGPQASPEQLEAMLRQQHGLEFARYLLATVLRAPTSLAVQYTYAGESEVEDTQADAIDVSGPNNFAVRLFFDKKTHLPLLLSYRGRKPRIMTSFVRSADPHVKPEDAVKKAQAETEKKIAAEQPAKPEEVDFFIRLTEYRKVNGVMLPHKLTFLTESEVSEQFDVTKYQLNPAFKADKFQKN